MKKLLKHLELFSGIGGFRAAINALSYDNGIVPKCIGFSEIDKYACKTYHSMFNIEDSEIEIGNISDFTSDISRIISLPDFDLLTGGFPCQAFSMMGAQQGFEDARGNLFFNIVKILKIKQPKYFLLENVKNLKTHDNGRTFKTIITKLIEVGYNVYYVILNTALFGLAQTRNRIYICGLRKDLKRNIDLSPENILEHFHRIQKKASLWKQTSVLDVLQKTEVPAKYFLSERIKPTILSNGSGGFISKSEIDQLIARPLTATMVKMHRACQDNYYSEKFILSNGQWDSSNLSKEELAKLSIRKITPREALYLQGFPCDAVTRALENANLSDGQYYKQAGNAVSINVVYAVLYYLLILNNQEFSR